MTTASTTPMDRGHATLAGVLELPPGLVLLLVFNLSRWIILVFPTWMLMVSLIMLAGNARRRPAELAA